KTNESSEAGRRLEQLIASHRPPTDLERLHGAWTLVEMEVRGKKQTGFIYPLDSGDVAFKSLKMVIDGMSIHNLQFIPKDTLKPNDRVGGVEIQWDDLKPQKGDFRLNETNKPKRFVMALMVMYWESMYKLDGDTLTICFNPKNCIRPDDFRTAADTDNRVIFVFKREKPAQEKKGRGVDKRPDLSGIQFVPETKKPGGAKPRQEAAATDRAEKKADEPEKPISPSRSLKGTHKIWSVSCGPDGKALATVTFDAGSEPGAARTNAVRLWDVRTGEVVRTFAEDQIKDRGYSTIAGVALSPDGKTVAAPASGKFDGEDGFSWLVLWDAETGKIRHKLKHPFFEVRALAFSRDSKLVATGTGINGGEQDFEAVKLWDVQTGQVVRTLQTRKWAVKLAFAPDSKLLAAVLTPDVAPDEVVIWNPAEGKSQTLPDSEGIEAVAFSPDGKVLLGASRTKLRRWNATTGKIIE